MIALKNESQCEYNFNKVYLSRGTKKKEKKTIGDLKKTSSSDSLQSYESNVVENDKIDIEESCNVFSDKIKFRIFDDIDFVNIDKSGHFELSISLPSNLNIISINKIKLSSKILLSDINILSNNNIIYKKEDILFLDHKFNKLDCSECIKDIVINLLIDNKNINHIVGKQISISYTRENIKDKQQANIKF